MQLVYVTHQYFPDHRTNTYQSMAMIQEFQKLGFSTDLIYCDRKKTGIKKSISEFYQSNNDIKTVKLKSLVSTNKKNYKFFQKLIYVISQFEFSFKAKKYLQKNYLSNITIYTRSPYVLFVLNKFSKVFIFEIHQITRMTSYLIKKSLQKNEEIKFVVVTPYIKDQLLSFGIDPKNILYLETGYDESLFAQIDNDKLKDENKIRIIFGGTLEIQGISKNLENLVLNFLKLAEEEKIPQITIDIYTTNSKDEERLNKYFSKHSIKGQVNIYEQLPKNEFYKELINSDIGLLPLPDTHHTNLFSSSMKFFEYIRAGLLLVCSDVEANRRFNYPVIFRYKENQKSIENAILDAFNNLNESISFDISEIIEYSYQNRAKKIINTFIY